MSIEPVPDWVRPVAGFTATDLDELPGLPPHTELIDGGLVFVSPQRHFHMAAISLLEGALRAAAPAGMRVCREMSVILDDHQRPEPDLSVIDAAFVNSGDQTWYPAAAVKLAIEVVSPDSVVRDRERKPQLYAHAGIPAFWRIEDESSRAVVHVYELDHASRAYRLTGIHHDRLTLMAPFALDIDLGAIALL